MVQVIWDGEADASGASCYARYPLFLGALMVAAVASQRSASSFAHALFERGTFCFDKIGFRPCIYGNRIVTQQTLLTKITTKQLFIRTTD